jgi:heat shock protein HtpX
MNQMRTFMLMAALAALFGGLGYLLAGTGGMVVALALAGAMNLYAWWNADRLLLRMHDAREVGPEHPLHAIVAELAVNAGLPMPRVYLIDQPQPNAFATGRDPEHAAVAATTGLLRLLEPDEIAGVMAHELAHVQNRDTLVMTVTATLAGAIAMLGNWAMFLGHSSDNRPHPIAMVATMIVAPIAAALVQMAISRTREYGADAGGARISGRPLALAAALDKLHRTASHVPNPVAEANPAAAALYIVNPLTGGVRDQLFSTHPAPENRIAELVRIDGQLRATQRSAGRASGPGAPAPRRRNPWR